jgi:hypothetical protein
MAVHRLVRRTKEKNAELCVLTVLSVRPRLLGQMRLQHRTGPPSDDIAGCGAVVIYVHGRKTCSEFLCLDAQPENVTDPPTSMASQSVLPP